MAKQTFILLLLISLSAGLLVSQPASTQKLQIFTPRFGDNIIVRDSDFQFQITWVNGTTECNANIVVRQGDTRSNLPQVALIAGMYGHGPRVGANGQKILTSIHQQLHSTAVVTMEL
jgi:hypothetical protein